LVAWLHESSRCRVEIKRSGLTEYSWDRGLTSSVRVGEVITIHINCDVSCEVDFSLANNALMLVEQNGNRLAFVARRLGATLVTVIAVDPGTLLSTQGTVTVEVVP
jgi:hypothetical protein